jgi:hypothetical protein
MAQRVLSSLALALALLGTACNTELQGHADVLVDALESDDYAKFQRVASPELVAEISEPVFLDIAATYGELGTLSDKTRSGTAITNGVRSVTYQLELAEGEVQLVVTSHSDKLDGFTIEGPAWRKAATKRQQHAIEGLLAAVHADDPAAVRALVHPSIVDDELHAEMAKLATLGQHTKVEIHDDTLPEFRVWFGDKHIIMRVRLSGTQIAAYSFRTPPAA